MTHWKQKIEYGDLSAGYADGTLTTADVAGKLRDRLNATVVPRYPADADLGEIVERFDELAHDPTATADEFDSVLSDLYDWADTGHRLWVNLFSDEVQL